MTWLAPSAFLGLLALAVPIVIHLITRRRTRVQRFPTLRFIAPTRVLPVRALRPNDPLLLVLRCVILAVAVAALAQPVFRTDARERAAAGVLARVVLVDTSASMRRAAAAGGTALEAAGAAGARAAAEADVGLVVETAAVPSQLAGAGAWLERQPGRREIVIVSDFQLGTIAEIDLDAVAAGVGIALTKVPVIDTAAAVTWTARLGDLETLVRATRAAGSTDATWSAREAAAETTLPVMLLAGPAERGLADATLAAVRPFLSSSADAAHSVAIVLPGYESRAELERTAAPPDAPWMSDVIADVPADVRVTAAARTAVDGRDRLLLFTDAEAGSLASAVLVLAAANALAAPVPAAEHEPARAADATLAAWRREPAPASFTTGEHGDGRWLWLLALVLLGAETWLRRPRTRTHDVAPGTPEARRLEHVA